MYQCHELLKGISHENDTSLNMDTYQREIHNISKIHFTDPKPILLGLGWENKKLENNIAMLE